MLIYFIRTINKCVKYALLCVVLHFSLPAFADPEYIFHTMSPDGGISFSQIKAIRQDAEGFMWLRVGSADLYRFDGYQYVNYNRRFQDRSGLRIFNRIETTASGQLYVIVNDKLYIHRECNDTFERMSDMDLFCIKSDSQDNIWVVSRDMRMFILDPATKILTPVNMNGFPVQDNPDLIWFVGETIYWIYGNTVYRADRSTASAEVYGNLSVNGNAMLARIYENELWVMFGWNELCLLDFAALTVEQSYDFFATHGKITPTMNIDKFGHMWIGSETGLFNIDPHTGRYSTYLHSKDDSFSIPDNSIWSIYEDRQQNIWIGTYSGGLCCANLEEKRGFRSYTVGNSALSHKIVSSLAECGRTIWIATAGGGIDAMDRATGKFSRLNTSLPDDPTCNNINYVAADPQHLRLWIAKFSHGIYCYDIKRNISVPLDLAVGSSLFYNDVNKIVVEPDSGLWLTYNMSNRTISFYSFDTKTLEHITVDEYERHNSITDIYRDTTCSDLWIVTRTSLYLMDVNNRSIRKMPLAMTSGRGITMDRNRNIWITGSRNELIRYSVADSVCHDFSHKFSDYNSIVVRSICCDMSNSLWMGTSYGLFRYDIDHDKLTRFGEGNGVVNGVLYPDACMTAGTGELYFGGTNGFTVVTPWNLFHNDYKPKALITDVLIDHEPVYKDTTKLHGRSNVVLTYKQTTVGIRFSSDSYLAPMQNRYKYRLVGYNEQWVETDASARTVFFSKLPAGKYSFEVLASNNDGVWGEKPAVLAINKLPAPWFTWEAWSLYGVLFVLGLYVIGRHYYRQKELKLALYKEGLEKRKREETHQAQLQFYTNVSHDLKSPLASIMATIDTLRKEDLKEYYYNILNNNSQRLLKLVNELLLFRTVKAGKLSLHVLESNVNALLTGIASDFGHYARQRHIDFSINCDDNLSRKIYIDRDIFDRIILNLLNNAFKFSEKGSISIATYSDADEFRSEYASCHVVGADNSVASPFSIVIRDSGRGISAENMEHIFDFYYKTDVDNNTGSGIGLALVEELVLLHKGSVSICSEQGKGTDIVLKFSTDRSVYGEDEIYDEQAYSINSDLADSYETDLTGIESDKPVEEQMFLREAKRILVVEDNDELRRLIVNYLVQQYDIMEAADGVAASDIIDKNEIDLIISDIMMPLKGGIALCSEVKNNIETSHIPVILLTAKKSVDSKLEGMDSGADVYIEKPVNLEFLLSNVRNIFKHREQLKEYYSRTYFAETGELADNQANNKFLKHIIAILEENLDQSDLDVNYIASKLSMSRSKLYLKIKSITGKTAVEFILGYRLRKAAQLITEGVHAIQEIKDMVGIESSSYFTRAFKKEFGETPTAFSARQKK